MIVYSNLILLINNKYSVLVMLFHFLSLYVKLKREKIFINFKTDLKYLKMIRLY